MLASCPRKPVLCLCIRFALAATPSQVSADIIFPRMALSYATLTTAKSSQGNITATSMDSYSFQQIGSQWNVAETIAGKITCSPSTAQLNVRFQTRSDIMGVNSSVSTDPNIEIPVSYVVQDRIIMSTPIGPNAPVGYTAKCTLGGTEVGTISEDTGAVLAGSLPSYVWFYIQTAGVTQGSVVHISIMTLTISRTQNVTVMNTSRPAFVGTITGFFGGTFYWDRDSGILLLAETTTGPQSDRMMLVNSTLPFTGTTTTVLATTSTTASQATIVTSATSVMSSVLATGTQTALGPSLFSTAAMIGLGLVALVAIAVLILAMRRGRSASCQEVEGVKKPSEITVAGPASYQTAIPSSPNLAPKPESGYKVCRYCGGKIPQEAGKCPECGLTPRYMGAG